MRILGISRSKEYSPNQVDNDAAILNCVAEKLRAYGNEVVITTETDFLEETGTFDACFSMARSNAALEKLEEWENKGIIVVNSPKGVRNCVRKTFTKKLLQARIPHPQSCFLSTNSPLPALSYPCWFKCAEQHTQTQKDVCYIACEQEALQALSGFKQRNVTSIVVNEHLTGDLIKFYGVANTPFFYWLYPTAYAFSKFGLEKINGTPKGNVFSLKALKQYASDAAQLLQVNVYGGDCIAAEDGSIKLIDFNDWPSFSRCREEAACVIAEYTNEQLKRDEKNSR